MSIPRRPLENAFYLFALFFSTGAFQSLFVDTATIESASSGSAATRVVWVALSLISLLRCISSYRQVLQVVKANKALSGLILLSIGSTLWSVDPGLSLHLGLVLLGTTVIALDFAVHRTLRELLHMLIIIMAIILVSSVLTELFLPGLLYHDSDAWQGAFEFKNVFGRFLVLTTAAFLSYPAHSQAGRIIKTLAMLALAGVVFKTHSAGALVYFVLLIIMYTGRAVLRWRPRILAIASILALMVTIPVVYFVSTNLDTATGLVGRDATLTGRTDLWNFAIKNVIQHPVLGQGYGAFWSPASREATAIRESIGWEAPTSHNGYLDLALDFGFVGIGLYFGSYIVAVWRSIIWFRTSDGGAAIWPLEFFMFVLLCQFSEASIVHGNSIYWILYPAVAYGISRPQSDTEESMVRRGILSDTELGVPVLQH